MCHCVGIVKVMVSVSLCWNRDGEAKGVTVLG